MANDESGTSCETKIVASREGKATRLAIDQAGTHTQVGGAACVRSRKSTVADPHVGVIVACVSRGRDHGPGGCGRRPRARPSVQSTRTRRRAERTECSSICPRRTFVADSRIGDHHTSDARESGSAAVPLSTGARGWSRAVRPRCGHRAGQVTGPAHPPVARYARADRSPHAFHR